MSFRSVESCFVIILLKVHFLVKGILSQQSSKKQHIIRKTIKDQTNDS